MGQGGCRVVFGRAKPRSAFILPKLVETVEWMAMGDIIHMCALKKGQGTVLIK